MYLCVRYIHTHKKNYLCCIRKVSITSAVFTLENKKKKTLENRKLNLKVREGIKIKWKMKSYILCFLYKNFLHVNFPQILFS